MCGLNGVKSMELSDPNLERLHPNLSIQGYHISSCKTPYYNCFAWASEISHLWIDNYGSWPVELPMELTLETYVKYFGRLGYLPANSLDESVEEGYSKVAIYANSENEPTHAARQLPTGKWTSKIGALQDIEHNNLKALEDDRFGKAVVILKKRT